MSEETAYYILGEDHQPILCRDQDEWAEWMSDPSTSTIVAVVLRDGIEVRTVFTGIGHPGVDHTGATVPMVFETRIVGGARNGEGEGYPTWEDAERGHAVHVERAFWKSHLDPMRVGGAMHANLLKMKAAQRAAEEPQ